MCGLKEKVQPCTSVLQLGEVKEAETGESLRLIHHLLKASNHSVMGFSQFLPTVALCMTVLCKCLKCEYNQTS